MVIISEKITPRSSYEVLLHNPMAKGIFENALSSLGVQDTTKHRLLEEFETTTAAFSDPAYTGDISHFKTNLYATVVEAGENPSLLKVLSTDEFVRKITQELKKNVSISLSDGGEIVSLNESIKAAQRRGEKSNILAALKGLYSFEQSHTGIYRDAAEIIAALKKYILLEKGDKDDGGLMSLVEKSKQGERAFLVQEKSHALLRDYTVILCHDRDGISKRHSNGYGNTAEEAHSSLEKYYKAIIEGARSALEAVYDTHYYRKEELDEIMLSFLKSVAEKGLSQYVNKRKLSSRISITDIGLIVKYDPIYKDFLLQSLKTQKQKISSIIENLNSRIKSFYWPTWEERLSAAPYWGAPITSDQEYSQRFYSLCDDLEANQKNLELMKAYIQEIEQA